MRPLTTSQKRVLKFIQKFMKRTQYPPSRQEISRGLGFASANAAQEHLEALHRKKAIHLQPGIARGIRLTP